MIEKSASPWFRCRRVPASALAFAVDVQAHAERYLAFVRTTAAEAGVPCATLMEHSDHPHDAICQVAKRQQCDLIVMASHGRRGLTGLLLGSETQRVLAHADVPVLVWRAAAEDR